MVHGVLARISQESPNFLGMLHVPVARSSAGGVVCNSLRTSG